LDNIVSFEGGDLVTISGLTGHGKTLFAQTLTKAFAEQEKRSLWFTYEIPAYQFLSQFGEDMPLFYMPQKLTDSTMLWIEKRIYEAKVKYGLEAVFVDHLHFLLDMQKNNTSLEIGFLMRSMKKLAIKYNIVFFLIAHTQKVKHDADLDNDLIRDSSFVAQESDSVIFVHRLINTDKQAILKITKNRRFGIINKKIKIIKVNGFLKEVDDVR
jgi:replicative DNA helicase